MRQTKKCVAFAVALVVVQNALLYAVYIPVYSDGLVGFLVRFAMFTALCRLLKSYVYNKIPDSWRASDGGSYVVVGASKGIGRACAQELLNRGAEVVLAARNTDLCSQAAQRVNRGTGRVLKVDLSSRQSMDDFIQDVKSLNKKMNALILNSGIFSPTYTTIDGIEKTFYVNHLSFVYLVHHLLKELEDNAPSRIIIVASDLHRNVDRLRIHSEDYNFADGYSEQQAYNHSKLCNVLFARALAKVVDSSKVSVVCVHPGTPVNTNIADHKPIFGYHFFGWRSYFFWTMARTADEGAQNLLNAVLHPNVASLHGKYLENLTIDRPSDLASKEENERELWQRSCQLLGLADKW